jgi:hypothetical protein
MDLYLFAQALEGSFRGRSPFGATALTEVLQKTKNVK